MGSLGWMYFVFMLTVNSSSVPLRHMQYTVYISFSLAKNRVQSTGLACNLSYSGDLQLLYGSLRLCYGSLRQYYGSLPTATDSY